MNQVNLAIEDTKEKTLNACWKSIWSEVVKDDIPSRNLEEFSNIIMLFRSIGGEGFEDFKYC